MPEYYTDFMEHYFKMIDHVTNEDLRLRLEGIDDLEKRFRIVANLPENIVRVADWEFSKGRLVKEPANVDGVIRIDTYLENINKARKKGIGLYIYGPHGVFKTTIAVIIAINALKNSQMVYYCTAGELSELIRSGWKVPEIKHKWQYIVSTVDLLIVDDLARLHSFDDVQKSTIDSLFVQRTSKGQPVIFTSNHNFEEAEDFLGPALHSMFEQHLIEVSLIGDDFRKEIASGLLDQLQD